MKVERGLRVRSRREELCHTIEDFSEITGLSIRTITDVELGQDFAPGRHACDSL